MSTPPSIAGDLYAKVFGSAPPPKPAAAPIRTGTPAGAPKAARSVADGSVAPPGCPTTLGQSGLTVMQIASLLLKQLYLQTNLLGVDMARHARLPFNVVDEVLAFLKDERLVEVSGGDTIGRASYRFQLTDLGRTRAREAFEQCRYVGPAPVSLESYARQCELQTVHGVSCGPEALTEAFKDILLRDGLLDEVGPAVCSGRSIFLYGPPGNGKTMVAKGLGRFLNRFGGEIYVPYAVQAEGQIITVFDPTIHNATDAEDALPSSGGSSLDRARMLTESAVDLRWRRIRRPVVITGGELTLDMLDLRYNATANFYQAPLHVKANGGVFLIDDFGRQIVSPRDLLNRWILPLEEKIDFLTLTTGKKFAIPFEQLIIFSTNLDPRELVDEAFLRRIRHKIAIGAPDPAFFEQIFRFHCQQRQIAYRPEAVQFLYTAYYDRGKPPRASDARDLLEIAQSICRFRNQEVVLTEELLAEAACRFFCQV